MHKSSKEQQFIIFAILISLLIHYMVLFFLFTHKSKQQDLFPFMKKKDDLKIINIIKEENPPPPATPQSQSAQQLHVDPKPSLLNPLSSKNAEVLEGDSVTDDRITEDVHRNDTSAINTDSAKDQEPGDMFENTIDSPQPFDNEAVEAAALALEEPDQHNKKPETTSKTANDTHELLTIKKKQTENSFSRQRKESARTSLSQLARAFSSEYDKLQDERRSNKTSSAGSVRRQQSELQTMSYRQKIDQAIYSSANRNGRLYSDVDVSQQIEAVITLDRKGKIIGFILKNKTISPLVNSYIERVVCSANFPPLPKHLNLDLWSYTWRPYVQIKRGMNNLTYQYH